MLLYLVGFGAALVSAWILHKYLKIESRSLFVIEMPRYSKPLWSNVFYTVYEKTKSFVLGAGKIILAISVVLWFLGSNGFSDEFKNAEEIVSERIQQQGLSAGSKKYVEENLQLYAASHPISLRSEDIRRRPQAVQDSLTKLRVLLTENARSQEIASYQT